MDLELYLREEVKKYENIGDFVYFNFDNKKLMEQIIEEAKTDFLLLLNNRKVQESYVIYLALIYIQMNKYSSSFWEPVRECLNIYDKIYLSEQFVDAHFRKIIDMTHQCDIEEINRQSIKVQFDGGISFPHLQPLYEICYDYYYKDLKCGLTESDFLEEAEFLLEGLKHKFRTESFEEDEITINSTVYRVIKATKLRILYSNDIMTDLLREILKLIDSNFWESIKYRGNHFIKEHFQEWANKHLSIKKKQLNIKSFVNKENTEHIVRKPNLYFDSNEIYFKIPDQKFKVIDEFQKTKLQFCFDGIVKEFEPSVKRQMIGYLLTGNKVIVKNPFLQFGYRIQSGTEILYENELELFNYYLFNEKTGSRINSFRDFAGRIILISRLETDIYVRNAKIISTLRKGTYKVTLIDISLDSVLSVEGKILSSYEANESGILIDKSEYFKLVEDEDDYDITSNKPLIIIPEDYRRSRLGLKVNGKNYDDLNHASFGESKILYDFTNIEFSCGIYHIEVIELTQDLRIYSEYFYYNEHLKLELDKDLYFTDEKALLTIKLDEEIYKKSISSKTNEIINIEEIGIKLRTKIPYISWTLKDYDGLTNEVFLESIPSRCILQTKNILDVEINNVTITSKKLNDIIEFDFSGIHNVGGKNEINVRANTIRGNVFLFKIYLRDFIDDKKCIINYNDEDQTFEGVVHYIGLSSLYIVIKANGNEIRELVTNNQFNIKFPISEKANIKFIKTQADKFGLFTNEDSILYEKEFKFFSPRNLINKVLLSEARIVNKSKKNELTLKKFNVKIMKHIGSNIYHGTAFIPNFYGGVIEIKKINPVRIEFMSNNLETSSSNFKIFFKDGEEIFSDWEWNLE